MNLLELNARLAVKLQQSLDTLDNMDYMWYSLYLNIINDDIEQENDRIVQLDKINQNSNYGSLKVDLPQHLKLK